MSAEELTGTKKKPKGRFVPSRYKQAAVSFISRSSEDTTCAVTNRTLMRNTTRNPRSLNNTEMNETVSGKKTSTPTNNSAALPTFDPSTSSFFAEPQILKDKRKLTALTSTTVKKAPQKKMPTIPKKQTNHNNRNSEAEIDILYAEYQLALFLENKAKRSLQVKSKEAMEKIDKALCLLKLLLIEHVQLQKENNIAAFNLKLRDHLEKQEMAFLPLMDLLPTLEKQYEEIAVAIDSVRHKLSVQDVKLPEAGSEGEIINLVDQVCSQMDEVLGSVDSVDALANSADVASAFTGKAKHLTDEIKRGTELLGESKETLLSNSSLTLASLSPTE